MISRNLQKNEIVAKKAKSKNPFSNISIDLFPEKKYKKSLWL